MTSDYNLIMKDMYLALSYELATYPDTKLLLIVFSLCEAYITDIHTRESVLNLLRRVYLDEYQFKIISEYLVNLSKYYESIPED